MPSPGVPLKWVKNGGLVSGGGCNGSGGGRWKYKNEMDDDPSSANQLSCMKMVHITGIRLVNGPHNANGQSARDINRYEGCHVTTRAQSRR